MDNRVSLYAAQYGKCAVTGKVLWIDEIHCHHKKPISQGGTDEYKRNSGSHTSGVDKLSIKDIERLSAEKLVEIIQRKFKFYKPNSPAFLNKRVSAPP